MTPLSCSAFCTPNFSTFYLNWNEALNGFQLVIFGDNANNKWKDDWPQHPQWPQTWLERLLAQVTAAVNEVCQMRVEHLPKNSGTEGSKWDYTIHSEPFLQVVNANITSLLRFLWYTVGFPIGYGLLSNHTKKSDLSRPFSCLCMLNKY